MIKNRRVVPFLFLFFLIQLLVQPISSSLTQKNIFDEINKLTSSLGGGGGVNNSVTFVPRATSIGAI